MKPRRPVKTAYYNAEEARIDAKMPLQRVLDAIEKQQHSPVQLWNPPLTGDMDLFIAADGAWYYQKSLIERKNLVKLLAGILRRDGDDYFLVTPSEKLSITVEDAPFVIVELDVLSAADHTQTQQLVFRTNVDELLIAGAKHPLRIQTDPHTAEPRPYLWVRDGLEALLTRNVFYQLVYRAEPRTVGTKTHLQVSSDGETFDLGILDD